MALVPSRSHGGTRGVGKSAGLQVIRGKTLDVQAFSDQLRPVARKQAALAKLEYILQDERSRQIYKRTEAHLAMAERLE